MMHPRDGPVGADHAVLALVIRRGVGIEQPLDAEGGAIRLRGMDELDRLPAQQRFHGIPEQLGHRRVHRGRVLLQVEHREAERGALEALAEAFLGVAPAAFRLASIGDVADVRDETAHCGNVTQVGDGLLDPAPRAVGGAEPPFDARGLMALDGTPQLGAPVLEVVGVDEVETRSPDDVFHL